MKRHLWLIFCLGLLCTGSGLAIGQGKPAPENTVMTNFTILVGFPLGDQPSSGGVLLVPGTVIPLPAEGTEPSGTSRKEVIDKSLSFTRAVGKLWNTFRLDPSRQPQKGMFSAAKVGAPANLPDLEGANVKITATLIDFNNATATYRIVFVQGEKTLADSKIGVNRGSRAVVGGTDGAAAPYIFVIVEPGLPGTHLRGDVRSSKDKEITEPVLIRKILPKYPEEAKKSRSSGVVVLELVIDREGKVEDVRALEDPDSHLTQAAIDAVKQWLYNPARNAKGQAVKVLVTVTLNFALR